MSEEIKRLTAFDIGGHREPIARLQVKRDWMDATPEAYAYRCLPMVMANQCGWALQNPVDFIALWIGGSPRNTLRLYDVEAIRRRDSGLAGRLLSALASDDRSGGGEPLSSRIISMFVCHWRVRALSSFRRLELEHHGAESHFGTGILTFRPPILFRTSPGDELLVKGPPNTFKDGAVPLEGLVESDWLPFTFTMNWKITRSGQAIRFRRGELICALLPYPRDYIERFATDRRPIGDDPELERKFATWKESREQYNQREDRMDGTWQKYYFRGVDHSGDRNETHRTRIRLQSFDAK